MVGELARYQMDWWLADALNTATVVGAVTVLLVLWALCAAVYERIGGR